MKLKNICKRGVLLLSLLIYLFAAGGINEVTSKSLLQTKCGEWGLQLNGSGNTSQDGKIFVEVLQSSDSNCVGKYLITNKTNFASIGDYSLGGYSLELVPYAQNANFVIIDTHNILLPGAPLDIVVSPEDPGKAARVSIQGQMTMKSYGYDFAFFALISVMKQAMPACIIPNDLMARTALRILNITSGASALFANGHVLEAYDEFSRVFDTLIDSIKNELAMETIVNCTEDVIWLLTGKKLEIFLDVVEWLYPWYGDYFEGEISYLTLSYVLEEGSIIVPEPTSPIAITPTPIVEPTGGPSDPNYVYEQVKNTIKYKDTSYLQEFFTGEWELGAGVITSCRVDFPGWSPQPLEKIEEYLQAELKCEGIEYTNGSLAVFYSGWEPDVPDCGVSSRGSDTAGFIFYRESKGGDFKLVYLFNGTMDGYNWGTPGVEPYNVIPCDTQNITNFEQAICPGALPQRLKIGEQGYVCAPEGVIPSGYEFYGGPYFEPKVIPYGTEFIVGPGPFCTGDGKSWFSIGTSERWLGYAPEGGTEEGEYYLCPSSEVVQSPNPIESTAIPGQTTCPGAPPQRLIVGQRGKVCTSSDSVRLREAPGKEERYISSIKKGTEFNVIDGPVCAGDGWSWWQVKTDDGQVGWMAEGGDDKDPYFLCPIEGNSPVSTTTTPSVSTPYPTPTGLDPRIDYTDMVYIPAGEFLMGCDDSQDDYCQKSVLPLHPVFVEAFFIDKYEVTNGEYKECVEMGVCDPPEGFDYLFRYQKYENPEYDNYPVSGVDPNNASAFCSWWGKRLPSESEWEKAARGTMGIIFPWGDEKPNCSLANFGSCADGETMPVGSYPAGSSPYGVMDMAGNVEEWMRSMFDTGWVVRGGGCDSRSFNDLETYNRVERAGTAANMGFRCAIDAEIKD